MKKWVCRLSIVCCLCLFFTSVKAQLSLGGLGDILNSSTVNKVVSAIAGTDASLTVADLAGTWKYSAPACKFESSDFLKSAGRGCIFENKVGDLLYKGRYHAFAGFICFCRYYFCNEIW